MTMFQGSMYVRVKRQKITYFVQADPSDTILEMKEKLQELIDKVSCVDAPARERERERERCDVSSLRDVQCLRDISLTFLFCCCCFS